MTAPCLEQAQAWAAQPTRKHNLQTKHMLRMGYASKAMVLEPQRSQKNIEVTPMLCAACLSCRTVAHVVQSSSDH